MKKKTGTERVTSAKNYVEASGDQSATSGTPSPTQKKSKKSEPKPEAVVEETVETVEVAAAAEEPKVEVSESAPVEHAAE